MGLFNRLFRWTKRRSKRLAPHVETDIQRHCRFEEMEPRRMLDASPLHIGIVYTEDDSGSDAAGDTFELTFVGGAAGTQLTRVVIDGDQNTPGPSVGDMLFDTVEGGLGADHASAYKLISLTAADPNASVTASVVDGSSKLTLDFRNFRAGDKLVFQIDVDEIQQFDPTEMDLALINDGLDPIASGVEFQSSTLTSSFTAPHFHDITGSDSFLNRYDNAFAGKGLNLPADNANGLRDRTTGGVATLQQIPKPISIGGRVFLDDNLNLKQDAIDAGIANVSLTLFRFQSGQYVSTGFTTATDANGDYLFGTNLNLLPGTFQVRETQPTGLFSVGAIPGTVAGTPTGQTVASDRDVLTAIDIPLGDTHGVRFDFAEAKPAALSGHVYADQNENGIRDAGERLLGGVAVRVIPVDTIVPQTTVSLLTDTNGFYEATGLAPGSYRVVEAVQPAAYFDGLDRAGTVNGVVSGQAVNPGDNIENIFLGGGGRVGVNYDFGEIEPASLRGRVKLSTVDGDCDTPGVVLPGVPNATVRLFNGQGQLVGETQTDANGEYAFTNLRPGTYNVVETTPANLIDGDDHVGSAGGAISANDTVSNIVLRPGTNAVDYDFCEHPPSSLSGFTYIDDNDNGRFEASETPLANTTVTLFDATGAAVATTTTGPDGRYTFSRLSAGTYTVRESQPAGLYDGRDTAGTIAGQTVGTAATGVGQDEIRQIALPWGRDGVQYNFGELRPVSISGYVFHDAEDDCERGPQNEGIAGVTVRVEPISTAHPQSPVTVTTDANGFYRVDGLAPGTYRVVEANQPVGFVDGRDCPGTVNGTERGTATEPDTITGVVLKSGDRGLEYNFGELKPITLRGYVYHDRDNDGLREPGEEGIGGVSVRAEPIGEPRQSPVTVTTRPDGSFEITGIYPGTYRLVETQPAGYQDGLDAPGTVNGVRVGTAVNPGDVIQGVTLKSGQTGLDYNFGEYQLATIRGGVHLTDKDGNCDDTTTENAPVVGARVLLQNAAGQTIAETVTDADGDYEFTGLLPGTYSVVELTPDGLFDGGAEVGTAGGRIVNGAIRDIVLTSGVVSESNDFCESPPSSLAGVVYHDRNDNGQRDMGEEPIANTEVRLLDSAGQTIGTQRTGVDGGYQFTGLRAGRYTVVETQPSGFLDGLDTPGFVDGVPVGAATNPGDRLHDIVLGWGQTGVEFNFGELKTGSIAGRVHADLDGDCEYDPGELLLSGVKVELLDATGRVIDTAFTDARGEYTFDDVAPGRYSVRETQPAGYFQGGQDAGSKGGDTSVPDLIRDFVLESGEVLVDYDFCEIPPASISGFVHSDPDENCLDDGDETPLSGVRIELLDVTGRSVATTTTDARGFYQFNGLRPGTYTLRETQPAGYFTNRQSAGEEPITGGTGGGGILGGGGDIGHASLGGLDSVVVATAGRGDTSVPNLISQIAIAPAANLTHYDFCELPPALLSGYVFKDGADIETSDGQVPEKLRGLRDGVHTSDDTPLAGVTLELRAVTGQAITGDRALPGVYPAGPIRTVTDARGYYEFRGLRPGSYAVYEVQPNGFVDGLDTAGTAGGFAVNREDEVQSLQFATTLSRLQLEAETDPKNDAILLINLTAGANSRNNNFSEVRAVKEPTPTPPEPPRLPPAPPPEVAVIPPILPPAKLPVTPPVIVNPEPIFFSIGPTDYTWHLSVVNGGTPRGDNEVATDGVVFRSASALSSRRWQAMSLSGGLFVLAERDGEELSATERLERVFGLPGAIPIAGDFNGDGVTDIGVYINGEWFIDLNGNGRWDPDDLWVKLGADSDLPVVGDWDGDGKDDIGIFGPSWAGDPKAIQREPGLPDPDNTQTNVPPKNLPPSKDEATSGNRMLKVTSDGKTREDVIDHVFHFGANRDIPVAGDWNGDGIATIGTFRDGNWRLDTNGDGRRDASDKQVRFGQSGDIPIVGDFDGDGVDEIGVFRGGKWFIDTNHNLELDAHDRVFELGGQDDLPVVGDWNGDGLDEPGVFSTPESAAAPHDSQVSR